MNDELRAIIDRFVARRGEDDGTEEWMFNLAATIAGTGCGRCKTWEDAAERQMAFANAMGVGAVMLAEGDEGDG